MSLFDQHLDLVNSQIEELRVQPIEAVFEVMKECWLRGGWVYVGGNGGSAAMAQHFATDWTKGVWEASGTAIRTYVLNGNIGLTSAISNDLSYRQSLSLPVELLGTANDIVFLISSSGASENVLVAAEVAKTKNMRVIGLSGFGASPLTSVADLAITLSSKDYQVIEDVHGMVGHLALKYFRESVINTNLESEL
jgi:phosphoheptose isomerase